MDLLLERIGKLNNTATKNTADIIFRTLRTCIEMLHDRGCETVQACQTLEEVLQNVEEARCVVQGFRGNSVTKVIFHKEDRLGVKHLRALNEASNGCNLIVVSIEGPTAFTRKEAEKENYTNVQFFQFRDLCVNITHHHLVPKHELMTKDDIQSLPYKLSETCAELPILYTNDKVAQYYAYQPGSVIRITRTIGYQEPVHYYRVVRTAPV